MIRSCMVCTFSSSVLPRKIAAECGGIMVQDTSWEGYEDVPLHIMQGYTTMGYEIVQQLSLIHIF